MSISHIDGAAVDVVNRAIMRGNDSWDFLIARDYECLESLVGNDGLRGLDRAARLIAV